MNKTEEGEKRRGTENEAGSRHANLHCKAVETRHVDDLDKRRKD